MPVLVRNVSRGSDVTELQIPAHPDGSFYRFEMLADGGWSRVYDDTATGLLDYLIPGYAALDVQAKITARITHATNVQVRLQAAVNTFFSTTPRTAEEQAVLTGSRHIQPELETWTCAVPLILIDAFYYPYTYTKRPVSGIHDVAAPQNMWWLRPAQDDLGYLKSLHAVGAIDLHIARDEAV